ncbi:MAG: hypothetical protein MJ237_03080 [bacterium]|nr:hypothetical protein [bacterium]
MTIDINRAIILTQLTNRQISEADKDGNGLVSQNEFYSFLNDMFGEGNSSLYNSVWLTLNTNRSHTKIVDNFGNKKWEDANLSASEQGVAEETIANYGETYVQCENYLRGYKDGLGEYYTYILYSMVDYLSQHGGALENALPYILPDVARSIMQENESVMLNANQDLYNTLEIMYGADGAKEKILEGYLEQYDVTTIDGLIAFKENVQTQLTDVSVTQSANSFMQLVDCLSGINEYGLCLGDIYENSDDSMKNLKSFLIKIMVAFIEENPSTVDSSAFYHSSAYQNNRTELQEYCRIYKALEDGSSVHHKDFYQAIREQIDDDDIYDEFVKYQDGNVDIDADEFLAIIMQNPKGFLDADNKTDWAKVAEAYLAQPSVSAFLKNIEQHINDGNADELDDSWDEYKGKVDSLDGDALTEEVKNAAIKYINNACAKYPDLKNKINEATSNGSNDYVSYINSCYKKEQLTTFMDSVKSLVEEQELINKYEKVGSDWMDCQGTHGGMLYQSYINTKSAKYTAKLQKNGQPVTSGITYSLEAAEGGPIPPGVIMSSDGTLRVLPDAEIPDGGFQYKVIVKVGDQEFVWDDGNKIMPKLKQEDKSALQSAVVDDYFIQSAAFWNIDSDEDADIEVVKTMAKDKMKTHCHFLATDLKLKKIDSNIAQRAADTLYNYYAAIINGIYDPTESNEGNSTATGHVAPTEYFDPLTGSVKKTDDITYHNTGYIDDDDKPGFENKNSAGILLMEKKDSHNYAILIRGEKIKETFQNIINLL